MMHTKSVNRMKHLRRSERILQEPKVMRELRRIRLAIYNAEKDLSPEELKAKHEADNLEAEKFVKKYGLKVAELPLR